MSVAMAIVLTAWALSAVVCLVIVLYEKEED